MSNRGERNAVTADPISGCEVALSGNVAAKEAVAILGISLRMVYRHGECCLSARRFGRSVRYERAKVLACAQTGFGCSAARAA